MTFQTAIAASVLAESLIRSDIHYFELGATVEPIAGVRLAWTPDFVDVPAGCVVLDAEAGSADPVRTLDAVEDRVAAVGGRCVRLYLGSRVPSLEAVMRGRGYVSREEIGFVMTEELRATRSIEIEPVVDARSWELKRGLHVASPDSPDRHEIAPERAVELERRKSLGGGMEVWLIRADGAVAGTMCSFACGDLLRLKNLLVHPELRRRGIGLAAIAELARRGRLAGLVMGAFAVAGPPEIDLYVRPGIVPVARWEEWMGPPMGDRGGQDVGH